jgi:CRP/FNR family transcriptional regulator
MQRIRLGALLEASLPFWESLAESDKNLLMTSARLQKYRPGTILQNSTDEYSPGVQIVVRGRARAFISSPDGKQLTLKHYLESENFVIGISCVLGDYTCDVSVETETECEVLLIPRSVFVPLFDANPAVRAASMAMLGAKLSKTIHALEALTFSGMKSRLAHMLLEQSVLAGSAVFKVTHADIAADIGTVREVVTRLLKRFQTEGLLTLYRGRIRLDDIPALMNIRGDFLGSVSNVIYLPEPANAFAESPRRIV